MKMPNFSKMTIDALVSLRTTIDGLLRMRVPSARKELEDRLAALAKYIEEDGRSGRKAKAGAGGRSNAKGRTVAPKYRGPNGETWAGRGMTPRWLTAAIKGGAALEDFAIGAGGRRISRKKPAPKRARKSGPKSRVAKRLASKGAKKRGAKPSLARRSALKGAKKRSAKPRAVKRAVPKGKAPKPEKKETASVQQAVAPAPIVEAVAT